MSGWNQGEKRARKSVEISTMSQLARESNKVEIERWQIDRKEWRREKKPTGENKRNGTETEKRKEKRLREIRCAETERKGEIDRSRNRSCKT